MGVIGNTIGEVHYVDLPITAGSNPVVSWNTDAVVDLIGIEVLAKGATAAALKVDGTTVGAGAIASFSNNVGAVHSAAPSASVPAYNGSNGASQANQIQGNGLAANWQSSGVAQATSGNVAITDRNGSVPAPGSLTPLKATIPAPAATTLTSATGTSAITSLAVAALPSALNSGATVVLKSGATTQTVTLSAGAAKGATSLTVTSFTPTINFPVGTTVTNGGAKVEVDLTGTVAVLPWQGVALPAADGNGYINLPSGNSQAGFSNVAVDSVPYRVKATDTTVETFAGIVRLVFQVPVNDPNSGNSSYPVNGINPRGAGANAGTGS